MRAHDTIEHFFTCPYCWQRISIIVEPEAEEQTYIEDCEVCCRPIRIDIVIDDGEIASFSAQQVS